MEDHDLATIVGTAAQTGAGGANVWPEDEVWQTYGDQGTAESIGDGATFDVAMRRTTRVRDHAGVALEDVGVVVRPGLVKPLTRTDVLGDNADLLEFAIEQLGQKERHFVTATFDGHQIFTLETEGVDRVDVYLDERPFRSKQNPNGVAIDIATLDSPPKTALFLGYTDEPRAVTSFRWPEEAA